MRNCPLPKLRAVAPQRKPGYLDDVLRSAVSVTETHAVLTDEEFRRIHFQYAPSTAGPGTELKALLATIGIVASPTCKCNKMAKQMDQWGQESLDHIEEIVDVMEETAKKRKLPFLRTAGRTLVRIACWKAKRKGNR